MAQALDYAKELARWDYEDLQREVSRRLGRKGNALYEVIRERYPEVDEARFVDAVHASLKRGRFLLLIDGDGIREGAGAIAQFLSSVGSLEFTFGLVELAIFESAEVGRLIQPRVIARTVELGRVIVEIPDNAQLKDSTELEQADASDELISQREFYEGFWSDLVPRLQLDDTSQPPPNIPKSSNLWFEMPPSRDVIWMCAFFSQSSGRVGVYMRFQKAFGLQAYDALAESRQEIEADLGVEAEWQEKNPLNRTIATYLPVPNVFAPEYRQQIRDFFLDTINRYVNTFRHRLERLVEDFGHEI